MPTRGAACNKERAARPPCWSRTALRGALGNALTPVAATLVGTLRRSPWPLLSVGQQTCGPSVKYVAITYTAHARLRTQERAITDQIVADVLSDPAQTYASRDELVAERILADGKPWRVVYVEEQQDSGLVARVVSVYRIRKLKQR